MQEPTKSGPPLSDEQMKRTVLSAMRDALQTKKAVSKDEIWSMVSEKCNNMGMLDQILNKIQNDGRIATAHDDNHFFIVD